MRQRNSDLIESYKKSESIDKLNQPTGWRSDMKYPGKSRSHSRPIADTRR